VTQEAAAAAPARGPTALRWGAAALAAVALAGGVVYAVRHKAPVEAEPPRDVPTFDGEAIRFSPAYAERVGLVFAKVESGTWPKDDNPLKNAPHTAEALLKADWPHPYTREQAAYPVASLRRQKYWSPVGRVDNVWGDRNLSCSCPPMADYR